jgi:pilus assembly protein FimV
MDKNKIIEAAAKLVAKGAYDKAIKEYQKVLEADPKDVRVLQKMGELYQKKNDNVQAAHFFTKVAESYSSDGFFLKAVALYKQVLKLNPNLLDVNLKLAELHQQLGLMSEAMAYFQIVANHHDKAGDTKASLDTLKRMVDLDPENVASKIKLAELYARENMTAEAVQEFSRAAEYLKKNARADDYQRVAERLSALEPDNIALAKELASGYLAKGDQKRALAKLQVAFKADGRDVETLSMLAQAFQGLGQTAKTISVYKELAKVHQDNGSAQEANGVWDKIAELDPQDPELLARSAQAAAVSRAQAPARAPARAPAPASVPTPAPVPARAPAPAPVARTATPAPVPRPAPAAVAATPPPTGLTRDQLAKLLTETDVYVKYGLHDKALEHLRKIFAVDPENLDAHEKAYNIYVAAGNTAQASEQLLNVLRLCTRRADVQRAQPYLATILQQNPSHPEVPAFLVVLRLEPQEVQQAAHVESVGEDAILVESNDEEIVVADPPDDALAQPPGDDLALATLSGVDSDEIVDEGHESTIISDETLVGETVITGETGLYGTDDEMLSPDASDETLAGGVVLGEETSSTFVDEPLVAGSEEDDTSFADVRPESSEYLVEEHAEDDEPIVSETGLEGMALGDEDEPPPTRPSVPSADLLQHASGQPLLGDDDESLPTRVTAAVEDEPFDSEPEVSVSAGMDYPDEPEEATTVVGAVLAMEPPADEPYAPEYEEPVAEPVAEEAAPEEEPASEECDEASFFLDQGLAEEAREILETVMIAFPGHARASELMARLEALEAGGEASTTQETETAESAVPAVQPMGDESEGRDAFDLAAELAGEIDNLGGAPAPAAEDDFQYSVEEVFAEFKKGLEKVVKPEDVDTHYDLGIAYKEMGLTDDALGEFRVARQGCAGKKRELDCITMLGMLHGMRGEHFEAVEIFREGLAHPHATGEAAKALGFELATAYEGTGENGKALYHYQRVAAVDPKYRDVSSQVARLAELTEPEDDPLTPAPAAVPPRAATSGVGAPKARKVGYV